MADHRRQSPKLHLSIPLPSPLSSNSFSSTPSKLLHSPPPSSLPPLFLLLLSLRSLHSLLPFLLSFPPSLSLFPFSFLLSLLSFLLSLPLTLTLTLTLTPSTILSIFPKSFLLSLLFLLRFYSLRNCTVPGSILADFSGALFARSVFQYSCCKKQILGVVALLIGIVLLSLGWDCSDCFPFSNVFVLGEGCGRGVAVLCGFVAGFLGFCERGLGKGLRDLGRRRRRRVIALGVSTGILFFPACFSLFFGGIGGIGEIGNGIRVFSLVDLFWSLINVFVFGVSLNENFGGDERFGFGGRNLMREFLVNFLCVFVFEIVYYSKLSLPGFMICGFFLWVSVWGLDCSSSEYVEIGNMDCSETMYSLIMNPVRHILSERKMRKIAFFLLINACYMAVEFVVGFVSNSLGLISDACHMLFDCAALAIGLYASYISRLPANNQFNYGRGRFEVLSGYANAVFLVLVGALIVLESIERILDPQEISTNSLLVVSIGGLVVNIIGLVFFHEEHHHAHGGVHSHSCSHLHSHSNSLGDSHGSHDCCSSSNSNVQLHSISHDPSHVGNNEHSRPHSHHHHHHHHDSSNQSDNHNLRQQNHDRHCDIREHDHHHQLHHIGDHNCKDSIKHKHKHQKLLVGIKEEGLKMHYQIDHNMEGIFLHVLADTMGSVGVVISTLLIKYKGWLIADPACSIFISVMIISSVVPLLRNSAEILLQRIPRNDEQKLRLTRDSLMRIEGVCGVQNFHVWSYSNTEIVGTVHLRVFSESDKVLIKKKASALFHEAGFKDIIIQVESVR